MLKFGGGCQGCSAVDMTLRQGVEVQLKQQVPELMHVVMTLTIPIRKMRIINSMIKGLLFFLTNNN